MVSIALKTLVAAGPFNSTHMELLAGAVPRAGRRGINGQDRAKGLNLSDSPVRFDDFIHIRLSEKWIFMTVSVASD